jgi:RNA polymerase sigma factor (sigma-70 family)
MVETPDTNCSEPAARAASGAISAPEVKAWFVREVLPLEAALVQFLNRSGRSKSEVEDLRQDVYMRVCAAAYNEIPRQTKSFVFKAARNLLIDRVRHEQIVSIESVENLDVLNIAIDEPTADRVVIAREELHKLQAALSKLPERLREAIVLQKIEGLSVREIADRTGVAERTVERSLADGVRALADIVLRAPPDPRRSP